MGANSLVEITFKLPKWNQRLRQALPEVYLALAAAMQTNRGLLFDAEGAHNGHPKWAPLKFRNGQILSKRGDLRKSLAPVGAKGRPGKGGFVRMSGDLVTIGTGLIMARMMNDGTAGLPGGVLRPTHAKALRIPLPQGKSATSAAKELGKTATSGKSLLTRVSELRQEIAQTAIPARRAKLREQLANLEKKAQGVKKNDKFIFRKSVKIEGRPFDEITPQDAKEIEETLVNKINEIIGGAA